MMVQAPEDMGEDSVAAPTDSHSTPIITQPSSSKPQKKQSRRKQRKDSGPTEPILDEYSEKVLIWRESKEFIRYAQAKEIASLKKRVNNDKEMLFDVQDDLQGEEVVAEKEVAEKEVSVADPVTTAGEVVTTANVEVTTASAPTTTIDELTLAQTLIEIKAAKPKAVTIAATITTTTRPKARGVVVQELTTKPPMIVEYTIDKDGRMEYFKLIRADGSSNKYSSMIKMLQGIDREDLETLCKLVKAKHGNTKPEEDYERVLWGDLKVMFKPDIKSEV
ncbi:hypothetical protein Tco_0184592 [Tanacetum coccineum]